MQLSRPLDWASLSLALTGAACVLVAASISIPDRVILTVDMTDFDWLTGPVARQAFWTQIGAWAVLASVILQMSSRIADKRS